MNSRPLEIQDPKSVRRKLRGWFARAGRDLPWRRTTDPYGILVSEFMLQQTQVSTVIPYYDRWMTRFPDFQSLAAAPESAVLHCWQGLGYYARARNLHAAAQAVVQKHGGILPPDPAIIAQLPGVGRYTAGAISAFAFDQPTAVVDVNIARVLMRMLDCNVPIDSRAGLEIAWDAAAALLPARGGRAHTTALMEFGALVCTARNPGCGACPVSVHCGAGEPESLPAKKSRRNTVALVENCAWIEQEGCVVLERQTGPRWRGLWKLPPGDPTRAGRLLWEATYPFTHHRVTLRVFEEERHPTDTRPVLSREEVAQLGMPSPHRRAMEHLFQRVTLPRSKEVLPLLASAPAVPGGASAR